MTDNEVLAQRKFKLYTPEACPSCHVTNPSWPKPSFDPPVVLNQMRGFPKSPSSPFRSVAPPNSGPPTASFPGPHINDAILSTLSGDDLDGKIQITDRYDQHFKDCASPWEARWSTLCGNSGPQFFIPVVDPDIRLVGHYGSSNEYNLIVAKEALQIVKAIGIHDLNEVARKVAVFHWDGNDMPEGYERFLVQYSCYVWTGPDGEVLGFYSGHDTDGVADTIQPLDVIVITKTLVYLSQAVGKRAVAAMVRRTLRRAVLAGPNREAAMLVGSTIAQDLSRGLKLGLGYDARMGIPEEHLSAMIDAAKETRAIAVLRANKSAAIPLIRKGAVPKAKYFKFKTSPRTGVLMATEPEHIATAYAHEYYVVDADGVARRIVTQGGQKVTQELPLKNPYWSVEKGQVIAPNGHPVVGDYDLLGVFPLESPGRNIVAVPNDLVNGDWIGPDVQKYANAVNTRLRSVGQPDRILHGAQDGFHNAKFGGLTDDTAYAVYPDGRTYVMEGKAQQEAFYKAYRRQTAIGQFPRAPRVNLNPDIGGVRRRR